MRARRDFVGVADSILVAVATKCVPTEIGDWTNDVLRRIAAETRVNDLKITDDALGELIHIDAAAFDPSVRLERASVHQHDSRIKRVERERATEFVCGVVGELAVSDCAAGAPHMHCAAAAREIVGESAVSDQPAAADAELNRTAVVERRVACEGRVCDLRRAADRIDRAARARVIVFKDAVVDPDRCVEARDGATNHEAEVVVTNHTVAQCEAVHRAADRRR